MSTEPWRRIVVFLVLTYALSSIFYWKIIAGGMEALPVLGLMWCPGVAAIVTRLVFQRNLRGIGWACSSSPPRGQGRRCSSWGRMEGKQPRRRNA
jgi:hypothetical protein